MMTDLDKELEEAFNLFWEGDEGDEPITDVSKKRAKEIFRTGYMFGRRKPIYQMNASQYHMLVKMIGDNIRSEQREADALLCEKLGIEGYGSLAIAAAIRQTNSDAKKINLDSETSESN